MSAQRSPLLGPGEHFVVPVDEERDVARLRDLLQEARSSLRSIGRHDELPGDRVVIGNVLTALAQRAGLEE